MIPKRAVSAILAAALGLALLFSFRTPSELAVAGTGTAGAAAVDGPSAAASAPATTAPATAPPSAASGTAVLPTEGPASAAPTQTAAPDETAGPVATATPPLQGPADGQYSGTVVNTRFGPVQVRLTISGGAIADVAALQMPANDPRSAQISDYVEPILRSAVLEAQSARVDLVSGATYTSEAYLESLQAALDQAGA